MRVVITNGGQEKTNDISKQSITLKWREKSWDNLLTGKIVTLYCQLFKIIFYNVETSKFFHWIWQPALRWRPLPRLVILQQNRGKKYPSQSRIKSVAKGGSDEGMLITESKAPKLETESSTCWKKCFLYATHCKTLRHLGSWHMLHNSTADWNNCSSFASSVKLHDLEYC